MRDLIPWGRSRQPSRFDDRHNEAALTPFFTLKREMDRLFDDALAGFGLSSFGRGLNWPTIDVIDREKEVRVTAELPGLEEKDIELHVEDNVLTVRGEKRTEVDDSERQYSERSYGRFERRISLPSEVDEDRACATFRNGVLTVTLPKTEQARKQTKRIAISH
ncbi:MAG: Hsp20/alpha crystallin family protein [Hyphomonadaceae bacterium]